MENLMTLTPTAPRFAAESLRTDPDWAPVRGRLDVGAGWRVDTWEEPRLPGDLGLDTTLVVNVGPMLRLAVIDAAENKTVANSTALALRATHTVRGWLRAEPDPHRALAGAARELCDPTLRPRQRNPLATVAVVDIDRRTGAAVAHRCADSEVWVRRGAVWTPAFDGDMLTPAARRAYETAYAAHRGLPSDVWWAEQERLIDDPTDWNSPAIGFEPNPRPQRVTLGRIEEVIVTTDGARLDPARCVDLVDWLAVGIQRRPTDWPHPSPHGDLAVLHARRSGSSA